VRELAPALLGASLLAPGATPWRRESGSKLPHSKIRNGLSLPHDGVIYHVILIPPIRAKNLHGRFTGGKDNCRSFGPLKNAALCSNMTRISFNINKLL
jgi:hypothetical protein